MKKRETKFHEPSPDPAQLGAPAVLNIASVWEERSRADIDRLEMSIRLLRDRQLAASPADDGEDFAGKIDVMEHQLESCRRSWKVYADMVYKLDRSVEPSKRSAEETITREEGAQFVTKFTIYMRTATERLKENIVPRIRESATNEDGFLVVDATLSEEFRNAMRMAVENDHLPKWAQDAMEAAL